ncbi:MAG: sigma 54-interacting transcriptional regulator [Desulfobacterales bacterium]|nr:sigma 54-interacting transcriptional regulator [Desulfobacterales bacterium]MCF8078692.1 sigma 54-interacting transcriptional regulator [Desulfobacterales bacterium]
MAPEHKAQKLPTIHQLFGYTIGFSHLLDEIAIGVAVIGLDRKIVAMNQMLKLLTGFSQKESFGVPCRHILRSSLCVQNCPAFQINGKSGPKCIETDLISKDRQLIPIRITFALLKTNSGKIVGYLETVEDLRPLKKRESGSFEGYSFEHIVGKSPEMGKIFQILPSLAQSESSVLITGETGTGKDMVAETIHHTSDRAKGPFVKVNCGALPETLLESELFGHCKGAFTGAIENKAGRFQLAHNGTLYLTEIGDLPFSLQVKLLTFLDDKVIVPLGTTKEIVSDVRIIAATHRNLDQMVAEKRFRKDLMFRLNVIRLHLPPLRERQGDVRLLLDYFLNKISAQLGRKTPELSKRALKILLAYSYPGNVRELRNFIEYTVNICTDDKITPRHLPAYLTDPSQAAVVEVAPPATAGIAAESEKQRLARTGPDQPWPEIEKQMIIEALVKTGGRKSRAADFLGWSRSTLWRKMKQFGIRG